MTEKKEELLVSHFFVGVSVGLTALYLICLFVKPKLTPSSAFSLSGLSGALGGCVGGVVWMFREESND